MSVFSLLFFIEELSVNAALSCDSMIQPSFYINKALSAVYPVRTGTVQQRST